VHRKRLKWKREPSGYLKYINKYCNCMHILSNVVWDWWFLTLFLSSVFKKVLKTNKSSNLQLTTSLLENRISCIRCSSALTFVWSLKNFSMDFYILFATQICFFIAVLFKILQGAIYQVIFYNKKNLRLLIKCIQN